MKQFMPNLKMSVKWKIPGINKMWQNGHDNRQSIFIIFSYTYNLTIIYNISSKQISDPIGYTS
jgi:hypothetical protein